MIPFFIAIAVIIAIMVWSIFSKKNKKQDKPSEISINTFWEGKKENPVEEPFVEKHLITKLYVYKPEGTVWKCRYCETENDFSLRQCSVCNRDR